jgi:hypothetical protein
MRSGDCSRIVCARAAKCHPPGKPCTIFRTSAKTIKPTRAGIVYPGVETPGESLK